MDEQVGLTPRGSLHASSIPSVISFFFFLVCRFFFHLLFLLGVVWFHNRVSLGPDIPGIILLCDCDVLCTWHVFLHTHIFFFGVVWFHNRVPLYRAWYTRYYTAVRRTICIPGMYLYIYFEVECCCRCCCCSVPELLLQQLPLFATVFRMAKIGWFIESDSIHFFSSFHSNTIYFNVLGSTVASTASICLFCIVGNYVITCAEPRRASARRGEVLVVVI